MPNNLILGTLTASVFLLVSTALLFWLGLVFVESKNREIREKNGGGDGGRGKRD